ncbi:putative transposase [Desmospora profundinema]|uniref:Transposase n=2 Tax=Desmospora profundinema TaxID=1571184 RepID=A0ABU1IMB5_9BACL|nr:putative transposase [Desmospora profundinema]
MCRWLYNSMLEQRRFAYQRQGVSLSYHQQATELPWLKKEIPKFKQVHSQVLQQVAKRLDLAFQHFFRRVKNGEKPGFPRFQGKNRFDSMTYPQAKVSMFQGKFIRIPKIGEVRVKMHRQMEGSPKTLVVKRKNGRYYVMVTCTMEPSRIKPSGKQVGIDLGVKHFAVTSDKEFFPAMRFLEKGLCSIKRLQRTVSRRKKGSHRQRKAVALLAKAHERVANQRKDLAHKISRSLVDRYDLIAFEKLNVKGMVKNRPLAKKIADAAWRQLIDFTTYKAEWAGKEVKLVDPRNTSQACSKCGRMVKKSLEVRMHTCSCGYTEDRDVNAARNILLKAMGHTSDPRYDPLQLQLC